MENTESRKSIEDNLEARAFCAKDIERILRANGWHHGDDTVEGKIVCTYKGQCNFKKGVICHELDRRSKSLCEDGRPATIKDLIT